MRQPELGKKLAELRKSKRLTQEELVEKCNISVRTIQRIEAGEVTPRDYTVKTILAALDQDLNQFSTTQADDDAPVNWFNRFLLIEGSRSLRSSIGYLNQAMVAGIVYFILRFVEAAADISRFEFDSLFTDQAHALIKVGVLLSFIFFQRGFVLIADLFDNYLLKVISLIYMGVYAAVIALDLISLLDGAVDPELVVAIYAVAFGAIGFIYGVSLIRLKDALGTTPKLAGLLEIGAALFSITIILSFISSFILIPAELLEIMILFKAAELIRKQKRSSEAP